MQSPPDVHYANPPVSPTDDGHPSEAALIRQFEGRVRAAVRRRVHPDAVEDVVQDVLRAVLQAVRENRVHDADRLPGFVHGVTRNVVSNWARRRAQRDRIPQVEEKNEVETIDALGLLLEKEQQSAVTQCLHALAEDDRELLYLSFYRGMTPAEVAEEKGIAPNVARQRLWRARERFKVEWEQRNEL